MTTTPLDPAEQQIADLASELADALLAEPFYASVLYDEDGDEGWHVTIEAGAEHYREEGGTSREFTLAYWTRDETWYWETLGEDSRHSGPWPHRTLHGGSSVADVVDVVRAHVPNGAGVEDVQL
jgi:hypothetical protein